MTRDEALAVMRRDQGPPMLRTAHFSDDKLHRLFLLRVWDASLPILGVVMVNPSLAGAHSEDPTMQSVIRIAKFNGFGGVQVGNLCSYVQADPDVAASLDWPTHAENDAWLAGLVSSSARVACGWGAPVRKHAKLRQAATRLLSLVPQPLAFRVLADGTPGHPLYLPEATPLVPLLLAA